MTKSHKNMSLSKFQVTLIFFQKSMLKKHQLSIGRRQKIQAKICGPANNIVFLCQMATSEIFSLSAISVHGSYNVVNVRQLKTSLRLGKDH